MEEKPKTLKDYINLIGEGYMDLIGEDREGEHLPVSSVLWIMTKKQILLANENVKNVSHCSHETSHLSEILDEDIHFFHPLWEERFIQPDLRIMRCLVWVKLTPSKRSVCGLMDLLLSDLEVGGKPTLEQMYKAFSVLFRAQSVQNLSEL